MFVQPEHYRRTPPRGVAANHRRTADPHQTEQAVLESAFLTLDLKIAKPDGGWHLYYACLSSVIAIFPSQQAKAALD